MLPNTFRGRILVLGVLALALVLGLFALEVVRETQHSLAAARDGVVDLSGGVVRELDGWVGETGELARRLALHPAIQSMDAERCRSWLREAGPLLPGGPSLLVADAGGRSICSTAEPDGWGEPVHDRPWFRMVREEGRFVVAPVGSPLLSAPDTLAEGEPGSLEVVLAHPVHASHGAFLGAVALALPLAGIQDRLPVAGIPEASLLVVVDSSGVILAHSLNPAGAVGVNYRSAGLRDPPPAPRGVMEAPGLDDVERLWGYARAELSPWTVAAGVPSDQLTAPVWRRALQRGGLGFGILFLLGMGLWGVDRTVRQGFQGLQRGAREAGRLRGVRVREEGPAEFQEVARSLNRTLEARDRAEEGLAAALERHELVLRATRDMIWDWNPVTGEVQRNEALRSFTGDGAASPDPGTTETLWFHRIPEPDRSRVRASLERALAGGDSIWVQEYPMARHDGSLRRILDRGYVVRSDDGRPTRVVGIMSDVTEERERAAEIQRARDRYESILLHAPFGVFLADPEGEILEGNPALEGIVGTLGPHGGHPRRAQEFFQDPRAFRELVDDLRREGTVMGREALWRRGDGEEIYVRLNASAFPGEDRSIVEVMVEDVSERRRLGEQMRQVQRMEAVGRLAGGVAHDFNNLLTVIAGEARLLLSGEVPEGLRESVEAIREAGDRGSALTRQLLAFSRRKTTRPSPLDLNEVVDRIQRMLLRLLGEGVDLRTELSPGLPPVVVDGGEMEQVIMNLVLNARDAMPEGGTLRLATAVRTLDAEGARQLHPQLSAGTWVILSVTDQGTGIDPEVISRIFDPFFTTKPVGKGTGLGLATVYGVATRAGGQVVVSSRVGVGSTFRVVLPAALQGVDAVAPTDGPTPVAIPAEGEVVLVEDEESVRRMAARILERGGFSIRPFATPTSALAAIRDPTIAIDLLLTDVKMPGMSGEELALEARRLRPHLPVVFMSGYPEESDLEHRLREPLSAFIPKPFTPDALLEQIRLLLEASRAVRGTP